MSSKLAKRYRKRHRSNPDGGSSGLAGEVLEITVPALAGFGATRLLTKLAVIAISKKWPSKAKHGGALASIGVVAALWMLMHRVKSLAKYQGSATAGSAIAAVVNLIQLYLPKLGWLVGDPTELTAGGTASSKAVAGAAAQSQLPAGMEEIDDDPAHYTYNDAHDAGRYANNDRNTPQPGSQPALEDETWGNDNVFAGGLAGH